MTQDADKQLIQVRQNRDLSVFDIVSIDDLSLDDIQLIHEIAGEFKKMGNKKYELLKDKTIFNLFFENSTRTRSSFELAGKKLGADVINVTAEDSSVKKNESLQDTLQTINALRPEAIVIRTSKSGIPSFMSKMVKAAILNAGDGLHQHPTQALLDAMTMLEHHGSMKGKIVTIVGDIMHSRVFGSLVRILKKLEAEVRVASPETFVPRDIEQAFPVKVFHSTEEALNGAHVVYALRVQEERGSTGFIPNLAEYSKSYCITPERLKLTDASAILMHAGPVIRNVDVHSSLVNSEQSRILQQVENGLAVRQALLWLTIDRYDGKAKENNLI